MPILHQLNNTIPDQLGRLNRLFTRNYIFLKINNTIQIQLCILKLSFVYFIENFSFTDRKIKNNKKLDQVRFIIIFLKSIVGILSDCTFKLDFTTAPFKTGT